MLNLRGSIPRCFHLLEEGFHLLETVAPLALGNTADTASIGELLGKYRVLILSTVILRPLEAALLHGCLFSVINALKLYVNQGLRGPKAER